MISSYVKMTAREAFAIIKLTNNYGLPRLSSTKR